jgi:hypothetical protein
MFLAEHLENACFNGSGSPRPEKKLLNHSLEGHPLVALPRSEEAFFHRFGLEQECRFPFRFDFAPRLDRHNVGHRFSLSLLELTLPRFGFR